MANWTSKELRAMYLKFFESKGHAIIPSASLIPENDPTVLFTTAGMHPLVPYLLGAHHPAGSRLTDVQKCIRTGDIDEVGDASHLTFFEMLGNWSLGDYFKKEAITWSWEFLTSPQWLGLDPSRLAVSVFAGNEDCQGMKNRRHLEACGLPKSASSFCPRRITGGAWAPASAPADPIRKCSSSATSRLAAPTAPLPATAAVIWKSGMTYSCSSTAPRPASWSRWPRKM